MSDLSRGDAARTRAYVSPRRAEQAKATRRAILDAARRLFLSNGYGPTSISAVAEEAGVAVQTVYAVFGNKRQLVIELVENAVTGDDHLVDSRAEDSEASAVRAEPDPRRRAQLGAALSRKIIERLLPVFKITSDAAAVDPDFAELNQAMIARRRAEMADGATLLAGDDGLRVSPDDAAASLFVLCSPHVAQLLTEHLGWSFDRYQTWLADAIERLILNDQIADEASRTNRTSTSTAEAEPAP
jgi:TetR/AcrR family transcriptional regulator, regulator of autoinduction and epiphytic fitness